MGFRACWFSHPGRVAPHKALHPRATAPASAPVFFVLAEYAGVQHGRVCAGGAVAAAQQPKRQLRLRQRGATAALLCAGTIVSSDTGVHTGQPSERSIGVDQGAAGSHLTWSTMGATCSFGAPMLLNHAHACSACGGGGPRPLPAAAASGCEVPASPAWAEREGGEPTSSSAHGATAMAPRSAPLPSWWPTKQVQVR